MPATQIIQSRLVDTLAEKFNAQVPDAHLPLIISNALVGGRSRHLLVIWDEWKKLTPGDRSKIILDAYQRASGSSAHNVTVSMGLTPSEALSMGYLKYKIQALVRPGDRISSTRIERALESAGGVVNKIGDDIELRFATNDQAQHAYRRLQTIEPGPFWTIVQELPSSEN